MKADFLLKFNEIMKESYGYLWQRKAEWQQFLEVVHAYFENREIINPIVVEIGTAHGAQKRFYQELLNAEYIGLDITDKSATKAKPDIIADSHDPKTIEILRDKLAGRSIDLLFIDGEHDYKSVECDYRFYAPLVKHLIALHDIFLIRPEDNPLGGTGVMRLWAEIIEKEKEHIYITFKNYTPKDDPWGGPWQMGIGMIIKQGI